MKQLTFKLSDLFLLIMIIFLFYSCEKEEVTLFSHCTTISDQPDFFLHAVIIFTEDNDGNKVSLLYKRNENDFPGEAIFNINNNENQYNIKLKSNTIGEQNDLSINFEENGSFIFEETAPYKMLTGSANSSRLKDINYMYISSNNETSKNYESSVNCDQLIINYEKRINEKDSIRLVLVEEIN